jgi:hypothetical protein
MGDRRNKARSERTSKSKQLTSKRLPYEKAACRQRLDIQRESSRLENSDGNSQPYATTLPREITYMKYTVSE